MHECCWFQQRGQHFLYKLLAKVDSAGMVTLLPRTGFLCTEGSLVFYQADYCLNCFSQNCQMLTLRTCGGGGGGGLSFLNKGANGDVPLDGVAFS